jgi:putative oxidoreductase-like protein/GFO/IDH/MocA oxidoreductase family protein
MKQLLRTILFFIIILDMSCQSDNKNAESEKISKPFQLVTLDPGHFHAALVQKLMYADVDSVVHVYAPPGNDLKLHLARIDGFNTRAEKPTTWKEVVYTGDDFFEKMIAEKKGNVVVLSGNNAKKTEYILEALEAGFNVLADKPMAITYQDFELLKKAFAIAKQKNLVLYDIMTERFEINTILQRELSQIPEIFGTLEKGTQENPAVRMLSSHCFYKMVSGNVLTRPAWFFDVTQQGEGIVDVNTHLVDLVQWECFPNQVIDTNDISIIQAKRMHTEISISQFKEMTKEDSVPAFLKKDLINGSTLSILSNGSIDYTIKSIHVSVMVDWEYTTEAKADLHYSLMRGTKANLFIRQDHRNNYKPTLSIEPIGSEGDFEPILNESFKKISSKFPGVELYKTNKGWSVKLPESLMEGHEAHFARVTNNFLDYLKNKNMPAWEVPNMLAKYYTTTKAREVAVKSKR